MCYIGCNNCDPHNQSNDSESIIYWIVNAYSFVTPNDVRNNVDKEQKMVLSVTYHVFINTITMIICYLRLM
jgi:hypothetical protein